MRASLRRLTALLTMAAVPLWAACDDDDNGTGPTPSIDITVSPETVTLDQGQEGSFTVNLTRSGGFEGGVNIAVTGLPTGVTASSPTIGAGETTADVTLTATEQADPGSSTLTVQAMGTGVDAASTTVDLEITEVPAAAFTLTLDPADLEVEQGATGSTTIQIERTGGFEGAVDLEVAGAPEGLTATLDSASVGGNETSLNLEAAADLAADDYTLTITGSGEGVEDFDIDLPVTVTEAAAGINLTLDPEDLTIEQGATGSTTIQIERLGGFEGAVDLEVAGAPEGLTATLDSASVGGDETSLELEAAADLAADDYTLTITGSGEGVENFDIDLPVTVTESTGGGTTQASWTFCTNVPDWFAVRDGRTGEWMQVEATNGNTFDFEVSADVAGIAYVQEGVLGSSDLNVHLMGANELQTVGGSFCEEAGDRTVNVTVEGLSDSQTASLSLGATSALIIGAVGNTATFEEVPPGTLDLFGVRSDLDTETGAQSVDRFYLERDLDPADGSEITVDFDGANSFAPVTGNATISNLGTDEAGLALGYTTPNMGSFFGLATFGESSTATDRTLPMVPEAEQGPDDLHTLFVSATPDVEDPDRQRSVIQFFAGNEDQEVTLGSELNEPTITTPTTVPYAQPRVEYMRQSEYDRSWSATFDQDAGSVSLLVTDEYQEETDFDVTFPDLSAVPGWSNDWGLQAGQETDVTFTAFGWDAPGAFIPGNLEHGMQILSATWLGTITP